MCFKGKSHNVKASITLKQCINQLRSLHRVFHHILLTYKECVGNSQGELVPKELESLQTSRRSFRVNY